MSDDSSEDRRTVSGEPILTPSGLSNRPTALAFAAAVALAVIALIGLAVWWFAPGVFP